MTFVIITILLLLLLLYYFVIPKHYTRYFRFQFVAMCCNVLQLSFEYFDYVNTDLNN